MNKKWFPSLLTIGSIAVSSYYYGAYEERQKFFKNNRLDEKQQSELLHKHSTKPAFPSFAAVSAAEPAVVTEVNLTATPWRISQIMKYGFPSLDNVRSYSDFVLSYDRRNRVPYWVFEHLTAASVAKNEEVDRAKCDFKSDESIHPYFRSQNSDYFRSGFDRGHMAAAGNHRLHQKHCADTFFLTNMAPQVGQGFNRDAWNRLEMYVRKLTKNFTNVYVCTGPLYLPHQEEDGKNYIKYQVIGANNVAVPTHFYKIIVAESTEGQLEMEAYIMPNQVISDDTPLQIFQVPPESVERAAGLLFFDKVNKNQLVKINGKKV
uniref:Endonuclease n=1 Tax=Glossina brevipalpis TaxID=37001 RepID=A0A1A9W9F9_9MUSC